MAKVTRRTAATVAAVTVLGGGYLLTHRSSAAPAGPAVAAMFPVIKGYADDLARELNSGSYADYTVVSNRESGVISVIYVTEKVVSTLQDTMQQINPATAPGFSANFNEARMLQNGDSERHYKDTLTVDAPKGTVVAQLIVPRTGELSNQTAADSALQYYGQRLWSMNPADWNHTMQDGEPRILYIKDDLSAGRKSGLRAALKKISATLIDSKPEDANHQNGVDTKEYFYLSRARTGIYPPLNPPTSIVLGALVGSGPAITPPVVAPGAPTSVAARYTAGTQADIDNVFNKDPNDPFVRYHDPAASCTIFLRNIGKDLATKLADPYKVGSTGFKISASPDFAPDATGLNMSYGLRAPRNMIAAIVFDPSTAPKTLGKDGYRADTNILKAIWTGVHVTPPSQATLDEVFSAAEPTAVFINNQDLSAAELNSLKKNLTAAGIVPPLNNDVTSSGAVTILVDQNPGKNVVIGHRAHGTAARTSTHSAKGHHL